MRKIVIASAALAAFGLALPVSSPAKVEEAKIVISTGDHAGDHYCRHHHQRKVVLIDRHHDHN